MTARPLFLVVTATGITAAGADDDVQSLDAATAAAFAAAGVASVGPVPSEFEQDDIGILRLPCPLSLAVDQEGVAAWSPVQGRRVALSREQVAALASIGSGVAVSDPVARSLRPLASLGILHLDRGRAESPEMAVPGYLRPTSSGPGVDAPGRPPRPGAVPVHLVCASPIAGVPLALGMLAACILDHEDGRLGGHFDLRPIRRETATTRAEFAADPVASVLLCSNYLWSVAENLSLSAFVKARSPDSLCVHGGPSTPKYPGDVDRFLTEHPHVDVLALGEGERTVVELLDRLEGGLDVDRLAGIPGTVVRTTSGAVVRGPERDRLESLDSLPSPYLLGLFDHLDGGQLDLMAVETNRGCPYGCTFCDWGSATMSRIRTFPLERVKAELEWVAARGVGTLFIADANFGVLPRDLEIAEHLVALHREYAAPRTVLVSFAKNQNLRAAQIVKTWIDGGIVTEGSIALQTSDPTTLEVIRRSNIRVDRYDELTSAFRDLHLPMAVDLMMGLPGATVESFVSDLQRAIDDNLTARIYPTMVLPNSPMNDPEYRREHEICTDEDGVVLGAASFDHADHRTMLRLRRLYRAGDHFGVLRYVAWWAQVDHGLLVTELLRMLDGLVTSEPHRWPSLVWIARHLARWTVPPPGWPVMLDEVRRVLVDHVGLPDDEALATSLRVQEAHLPWPGRPFPDCVELSHDYAAWFAASRTPAARELREFGPSTLIIDDPRGICGRAVGSHLRVHEHPDVDSVMLNEFWIADDWELDSPVNRLMPQVLSPQPVQT